MSDGTQLVGSLARLGAGMAFGASLARRVRLPRHEPETESVPEVEGAPRRSLLDKLRKVPRLPVLLALALVGVLAVVFVGNVLVAGTTFYVNSTGDAPATGSTSDGVCDTAQTVTVGGAPQQECTLRAAIQEANDTMGSDTIAFNIPGDGVHRIAPTSQLPTITEPVTIGGYTQPGATPNTLGQGDNANLLIELNGANAGSGSNELILGSTNSTVRGLVINGFSGDGVLVQTGCFNGCASANQVEGNYIGTDATGTKPLGNSSSGVSLIETTSNTVGGQGPGRATSSPVIRGPASLSAAIARGARQITRYRATT